MGGAVFFFLERGALIFNFPKNIFIRAQSTAQKLSRGSKKVKYYFWKDGRDNEVTDEILWSSLPKTEQYKLIVAGWLKVCQEEKLVDAGVNLEFVGLAPLENELYLSFNRPVLKEHAAVAAKWRHIESLLKTCRQGSAPLERVVLFVNHEPMDDAQLDFTSPLPITGFLQ